MSLSVGAFGWALLHLAAAPAAGPLGLHRFTSKLPFAWSIDAG